MFRRHMRAVAQKVPPFIHNGGRLVNLDEKDEADEPSSIPPFMLRLLRCCGCTTMFTSTYVFL